MNKFILSICLITLLISCSKNPDTTAERQAVKVSIVQVDTTTIVESERYIGTIEESMALSLGFPFGGKVTKVNVTKNQCVKTGDMLICIDDTQQQNALSTAQATLNQAQDAYDRLKQVYEQGALSEVKWVEMQTQLDKAKATYDMAQEQLRQCIIYAPQNGVIDQCDVHIGQQLLPSQTAIRLINTDGLQVSFAVPETQIGKINIGDETIITVPALQDMCLNLKGHITEKNMTANRITHSYTVKTSIGNINGLILPDMMCRVSLSKQIKKGFVVPVECVQTMSDKTSIWIVRNGHAYRQNIKVSMYVTDGVLVESGLTKGDSIITSGYQKVWDGAKIETKTE